MSVFVTLRVRADATKVEALAASDPSVFQTTNSRAKEHGVISHRFYGNGDEILVVDEWPSPDAFHAFFDASPEIVEVMKRAGVTSKPEITFWRKLDTNDDIG